MISLGFVRDTRVRHSTTWSALGPVPDHADRKQRHADRLQREVDDEACDDPRFDRAARAVIATVQIDQRSEHRHSELALLEPNGETDGQCVLDGEERAAGDLEATLRPSNRLVRICG